MGKQPSFGEGINYKLA